MIPVFHNEVFIVLVVRRFLMMMGEVKDNSKTSPIFLSKTDTMQATKNFYSSSKIITVVMLNKQLILWKLYYLY